jgi:hypothetical protein
MERQLFRTVFFSVLMLTLLCGAAAVVIATTNDPLSSAKQQLVNSLLSLFTLGAGAIIGLIGSNHIQTKDGPKQKLSPDQKSRPDYGRFGNTHNIMPNK